MSSDAFALQAIAPRSKIRPLKNVKQELNNQVVGNVGLYYVCYRLSCLGWNVMPTARNARGIDIMIYSQDAKQCHTIQVKSLSKCPPVPLGKNLNLIGDYFVICRKLATDNPECFVLTPSEVKKLAHHTKASKSVNGRSFWCNRWHTTKTNSVRNGKGSELVRQHKLLTKFRHDHLLPTHHPARFTNIL